MAAIHGNSRRYKKNAESSLNNNQSSVSNDQLKARLFLALACIWPLCLLALFASSAPHVRRNNIVGSFYGAQSSASSPQHESMRLKFRDILDRVDVMGYGPTHPRVAIVLVGDDSSNILSSVESVFKYTDLNRIFVVCVVVDGKDEDEELIKDLEKIDSGSVPHWHGFRPDVHSKAVSQDGEEAEDDPHGKKIHIIFNKERLGVAQSRQDAVDFITLLEQEHENSGLKSVDEDLILLLIQNGAQLTSRKWLTPVTEALIVPPPLLGKHDQFVSLKLANAVVFNLEGSGKVSSFDTTFTPIVSEPNAADMALSNGATYPTPALNGAAVALRLHTYINLPMQDTSLTDSWPADLDLAMNLWLCADGIDVLKDVGITSIEQMRPVLLTPELAARFSVAWMDELTQRRFFNLYSKVYEELTYLEWQILKAQAQASDGFTSDLPRKCRSFMWYAENVNHEWSDLLNAPFVLEAKVPTTILNTTETVHLVVGKENETKINASNHADVVNGTEHFEDTSIPQRYDNQKPLVPLCDECLSIVQKAHPVDINFEDAKKNSQDHPHMGGRDEDGNLNYLHDETALRKNPPSFNFPENKLKNACERRDNNWRMLNEKVIVDVEYDKEMEASKKQRVKLFCVVYTTSAGHAVIPNILETWGPKCDGFMVGSNKTDISINAVDIPHAGEEAYGNIWQKIRSLWSYVYDNYYEKYDWFHIGGDDLYLIVENLKYYLESEEIRTATNGGLYLPDGSETKQTPMFLGRRFAYMGDMNDIFNSGGSGYTLNKAALKTLVFEGFPKYFPNAHTFSEDTMVARIFRKFDVFPYETKDELGGERYMPFMPGHHYGYRIPEDHKSDWYAKYSINIKEGADHCAARSVAFHYVKDDSMKRLHALLYKLCPVETSAL